MSNLLPASHILYEGQPWYQVNMLAATLDVTERHARRLAAKLPPSETSVLPGPTSNRGLQETLFVSQPGAIEIALLSRSSVRADVVRQIMGALSQGPAIHPDVQAQLSAQTTALQAMHARLLRLENTAATQAAKKALPKPRITAMVDLPEDEAAAFLQAWRQQFGSQHVSSAELHAMAQQGGHMESLFAACNTTRGEQTRLGIWLKGLPGVRYHRTARTRKWRLGAEVVELATRRGA